MYWSRPHFLGGRPHPGVGSSRRMGEENFGYCSRNFYRGVKSAFGMAGTDDAFFELDDDECSLPSSPNSPSSTSGVSLPLPPKSAPPCPITSQQPTIACQNGDIVSLSTTTTPTLHCDDLLHTCRIIPATSAAMVAVAECRLQQSLSTPCEDPTTIRKDSEYRRFKSEGSSAGANLPQGGPDVPIEELSPIVDQRRSTTRFSLMQQDSVVHPAPITKHSHTEQVTMMHTLKTKLSKYQSFVDRAFELIMQSSDEKVIEGCTIIAKLMKKAWTTPKVSHDLSSALCDYLRDREYFDKLIKLFIGSATCEPVRLACGKVLEECMSSSNRDFIVNKSYMKKMMGTAMKLTKNPDQQRLSLSLMESLFKHSSVTSLSLIEFGVLDHILLTCKRATGTPDTLRHAALALANLALYTCSEGKKKIIQKKVPDWLFLLASQPDDLTRYYACLAICMLASSKDLESAASKSGTLALVEPFLLSQNPTTFAQDHYKHSQGRPKEWLMRLLPMLKSMRREARSCAAFHLTMEATIKKDQNKLDVFETLKIIIIIIIVAPKKDLENRVISHTLEVVTSRASDLSPVAEPACCVNSQRSGLSVIFKSRAALVMPNETARDVTASQGSGANRIRSAAQIGAAQEGRLIFWNGSVYRAHTHTRTHNTAAGAPPLDKSVCNTRIALPCVHYQHKDYIINREVLSTQTMVSPNANFNPVILPLQSEVLKTAIPSPTRPLLQVSPYSQSVVVGCASPTPPPTPPSPSRPTDLTQLPFLIPSATTSFAAIPSSSMTLPTTPLKTSLKKLPSKTALIIRPNVISKEKTVTMERFKRSRTRRFFHPYAKEIGAIQALKEVASSPDEVAAKFASEALTVIGEEVPYKLAQKVPSWTANDVQYWVTKIGFEDYVGQFAKHMVDGDLLLHLSEHDLHNDIGMTSGLQKKRFMRELESLKIAADYSAVDESNLDQFLMSLSPELSVYTYQMLSNGVNRSLLSSLTDDLMQNACGITNPIHRLKLTQAFQDAKHPDDVEVAMLSKQIDVFISYRRSTGNQLASLIKVLLQLRGYKVFIDVDKLYAGKFDSSLLKNIQAAKHFILVLTPNSLDRLLNDDNCEDWVHKELKCAFEYQKNIIPIFDTAFEFPSKEDQIPSDIRNITKYNGVKWVHDYQDACMAKVVRFIEGELNRGTPTTKEPTSTVVRKTTTTTSQRWNASALRPNTNAHRTVSNRMEPPTPTFTPSSSQEKNRRKLYQTSVSTVSDRM
ncbi:unnamed protein product [Caenorhabditis auriculariae]|uniref:ADP-ribosyl cyclase/cyclic ADP-ribose hydrolase n=1 Tax=Caenorhabditis auriculariae TaxID=2777116 RepID=A0A8S1GT25_9PELO|nr:unnamed protein product [Caenorhabditis auriculariae]